MGPHGLNTLPVRQSDTVHQREVVRALAASTVAHEVELGHRNTEGKFIEVDVEGWGICYEATAKIDAPLAGNVIGDEELADTRIEVICD